MRPPARLYGPLTQRTGREQATRTVRFEHLTEQRGPSIGSQRRRRRKVVASDVTSRRKVCPSGVHRLRCTSARVLLTTSSGSEGGSLFLSQPVEVSQSRTNCLSKDGWLRPGSYWSAGQNRELSGVITSSIRISWPSTRPHSNFVSAMMNPFGAGVLGAATVNLDAALPQFAGRFVADDFDHPLVRNVDVVPALLLGGRSEDRLGQLRTLLQAGGQRNAAHRLALLVLLPAGAFQVAPDDALDRDNVALADDHAASRQTRGIGVGRQRQRLQVQGKQVVGRVKQFEPKRADLRQHASLVRDRRGQHPVESTDPIGADHQQPIAQIVNVSHLAAADRPPRVRFVLVTASLIVVSLP